MAALRVRGWAERVLFEHDAARVSLDRGARLARRHGLTQRLVEVLGTRAGVSLEVGSFAAARRDINAARRALGGASTPDLDGQEAVVEAKCGEFIRAVMLSRRALETLGSGAAPVSRLITLNNLAMSLIQLGATDEAENALVDAAAIAAELGALALGTVTQTQALAAVRAGRLAQALERFDRAEAILKDAHWPLGEIYLERVESFVTLRLVAEAEDAASRAIRWLDVPGGAMLLAEALLHHARVLRWDGQADKASRSAERAVELFRQQRRGAYRAQAEIVAVDVRWSEGTASVADLARIRRAARALERVGLILEAVDAHLLVGQLATALGRSAVARFAFERARELAKSGPSLLRLKASVASAYLATTSDEVQGAARRGLDELARFRSSLPTTELRALASGHGVALAEMGLEAALSTGRPAGTLEWIERGRLASALVSPPRGHDLALEEGFANLREVAARQRAGNDDPDTLARLRAEQRRIEARIQRRMRAANPASARADRIATSREIGETLREDAALVAYATVRGRVIAVTVAGRRQVHELGDASRLRQVVDGLLFGLRRAARSRSVATAEAAKDSIAQSLEVLDSLLVAPLAGALGDRTHVVVIPTARMFSVPWHALTCLRERLVSVSPSGTMWRRAAMRPVRQGPIAVVAGPDLPGAALEVEQVSGLYPDAVVLVPPRSTNAAVVEAFTQARVAHVACHGTFRVDNPNFSSLELSDGPLTVLDLERIERGPELVVLASCDTGASEALPGEELRGFLTSLLMLGTRTVVASAIPVPDVNAASMMVALHTQLRSGATVVTALRAARATRDVSTIEGLLAFLAFGCFGVGDVSVGTPT